MSFSSDLNTFNRKFNGAVDDLISGVEIALYTAVILDTPVKSGRLRGNWFTSKNKPESSGTDRVDATGQAALLSMQQFVGALKGGRVTFLTNNLPYAGEIEKGRSGQAPQGMVRKNAARFKRLVNEQALKVKL